MEEKTEEETQVQEEDRKVSVPEKSAFRLKPKSKKTPAQKRKMKIISSSLFLLGMTVLVFSLFFNFGDISEMSKTFHGIAEGQNYIWLIFAFLVELVFFFTWPLSLMVFGKGLDCEATPGEVFLIGASEHFYSGVTPSASGGQPFQVYALTNRNVPSSKATGMIMMTYFTQLIATNVFSFVSLIYYGRYMAAMAELNLGWLQWVILGGFILNAWNMVFVFLLGTSKKIRSFLISCFALLCKMQWVEKRFGKYMQNFINYLDETQSIFKELTKHKKEVFYSTLLRCLSNFANYAITFFLMKAVGMDVGWDKFFLITLSTSFTLSSMAWLPTPGATGGIEYAFSIIIFSVMDNSIALSNAQALILLYRMLSYYFVIIISFVASGLLQSLTNHRLGKEAKVLELEAKAEDEKNQAGGQEAD